MANKKKPTKKKAGTKRRRSMGAIGSKAGFKNLLPMVGGLIVGAVGSTAIDKAAARFNLSPTIAGPVKILLGVYMTGSNKPIFQGIGYGVASSGAIQTAAGVGLLQNLTARISGILDSNVSDSDQDYYVNGIPYNDYVAGLPSDVVANDVPGSSPFLFNDPYNPGVLGRMDILGS